MAINKVIYGDQTLIDLTSDTATAEDVIKGKTFHDASGQLRTGTGGSGTGSELNDLSDVNINDPSNNQILRYNSGSGEWVNVDENVYIIDDTTASLMTYDSDYIEIDSHNFVLRQSWEVESVTQAIDRGYCTKVTPFITDITVRDVVIV